MALLPKPRGQKIGTRRLRPDTERLVNDVIDAWAAKAEHLPVAWILEECKRRTRTARLSMPSRRAIDARLRDRGLDGLSRRQFAPKADVAMVLTPRSRKALAIVQMDHTLVDIMVVDEVLRQSMGRPWITVAFDIATRAVLGFALRLEPPSATSVGLALAMACLPKDQWLKDRHLDLDWTPFGVPALVHVDNGKEFHSLALTRGCERYGISLEYRPPGRPQFGGHIERYLGTLMRRIHGLPGTTFSNPTARGRYKSEAHATMTMARTGTMDRARDCRQVPPESPSRRTRYSGAALGSFNSSRTAVARQRPGTLCYRFLAGRDTTSWAKRLSNQSDSVLGPVAGKDLPPEYPRSYPPRPKGPIEGLRTLPVQCRVSRHSVRGLASTAYYLGRAQPRTNHAERERHFSPERGTYFQDDRGPASNREGRRPAQPTRPTQSGQTSPQGIGKTPEAR